MARKIFKNGIVVLLVCVLMLMTVFIYDVHALEAIVPPEEFGGDILADTSGEYRTYIYTAVYPKNAESDRETIYYNQWAVGDNEIVAFYAKGYVVGPNDSTLMLMSRGDFELKYGINTVYTNGNVSTNNYKGGVSSKNGFYISEGIGGFVDNDNEIFSWTHFATNTYIFDTYENAVAYLQTGVLNGVMQSPSKEYDGEQVYLDNFQMIVHDSNEFDKYYLEFKYSIPEHLSDSQLSLKVDSYYTYQITGLSGIIPEDYSYYGEPDFVIDVSANPTGFYITLNDIEAIKQFVNDKNYQCGKNTTKRRLLGGLGTFSLLCDFGEALVRIDKSYLELYASVVADGRYGVKYNSGVNFLNGENYTDSFTPDSSGDYAYNDDYRSDGHYYTEVGTDAVGNTTYNYYYYYPDGGKTGITADDAKDNTYTQKPNEEGGGETGGESGGTGSGSGGGSVGGTTINNNPTNNNSPTFNPIFNNNPTITIDGDTITNDIDNIIQNDTTTKEDNDSFIDKFLGFFNLLDNNSFVKIIGKVFGWLPSEVFLIVTGAIAIVAGIAVIKFFRK